MFRAPAAIAATLIGVIIGTGTTSARAATPGEPLGGPRMTGTNIVYDVPAGVPKPPAMPAKGYLLADLTTGQVLVARDPHGRFLPASTLKVLTALTLLPRLDQHATYKARAADENMDGTRVGVVAGTTYTVHKLFQGLLMSSGNDAANALANAAGGVPATVQLMQQQAAALGARDTTVGDPSGLDAPGQRTSAYDLALIARAAMQRADFRALVATRRTTFPGASKKGKQHKAFAIQNHNRLLTEYRGAIGIKPGYTVKAKWTFVAAARRGGHTYVVTEMRLDQQGWKPTTKLLDWAFAHGAQVRPVGHLVTPAELSAAAGQPISGSTPSASTRSAAALTADTTAPSSTRWLGLVGIGVAAVIVIGLGVSLWRRRLPTMPRD